VTCGGCPSAATDIRTKRPQETLEIYAKAVQAGKYDRAYKLMSESFRKQYSQKEFVRLLQQNATEVKFNANRLLGKPRSIRVQASFVYGDDERLKLVKEQGSWKIATDPVDFYSQRTPAEALRSFIRAIERQRYDIVLRFVPAKWAESMTEEKLRQQWEGTKRREVIQLIKNLKANLNAPIHKSGNGATMPYGDNHEVSFVREDGIWKIEDPD
jgi:hypothetical protein